MFPQHAGRFRGNYQGKHSVDPSEEQVFLPGMDLGPCILYHAANHSLRPGRAFALSVTSLWLERNTYPRPLQLFCQAQRGHAHNSPEPFRLFLLDLKEIVLHFTLKLVIFLFTALEQRDTADINLSKCSNSAFMSLCTVIMQQFHYEVLIFGYRQIILSSTISELHL